MKPIMHNIVRCLLVLLLVGSLATMARAHSADWKITLKVSGAGTYGYCAAGESGDATDGYDRLWDTGAMLSTLNEIYIYSYFPHPEWNEQVTNFSEDIKAHGPHKEWLFEVDSNYSGPLSIQWPDLAARLGGHGARLVDLQGSGGEIDMQAVSSFTFQHSPAAPRQFKLVVDEPAPTPAPETLWANLKDKTVVLHWPRAKIPNAAGYLIYRKIYDRRFERITSKPIKMTIFHDTILRQSPGLPAGTTLVYIVVTVDEQGRGLQRSNPVSIVLP